MLESKIVMKNPHRGKSPERWAVGFGLLALLGTWIVALSFVREDRAGEISRAESAAESFSLVLQRHVDSTVDQIESSLFALRRNWESGIAPDEMRLLLRFFVDSNPELYNLISVIDVHGNVVASDRADYPATFSGDRPFFVSHRDAPGRGLALGGPVLGRLTGKWYFPASVRIENENGEFSGVLLASVNPQAISSLFKGIDLGRDSVFCLADSAGNVFAGMRDNRELEPEQPAGAPDASRTRSIASLDPFSPSVGPGPLDDVLRARAKCPVAGRGLAVAVGIGLDEWLAPWRSRATLLLALQAILSLCIVGVAGRLRSAMALRETAARELDRFFSSAIDRLCIVDPSGRFRRANKEWGNVLGRSPAEFASANLLDWVHPEDLDAVRNSLSGAESDNAPLNFCCRVRASNGSFRHLEWRCAAHGSSVFAAARDVTDRIRAEDNLRLFMEAIDNADDAIGMSTPDGRHFYQNRAFTRLFGTLEDGNPRKLFVDTQAVDNLFSTIMAGRHWTGEFEMRGADGQTLSILLRAYPAKDASGAIRVLVGMHADVTQNRRDEAERGKLRDQLQQAQKMESVGRLAGGVAHDFNNMLAVIIGNVELLLDSAPDDSPLRAELVEIRKAAERSADLVRQLLAFARKQTVAPKIIDLNETVAGMLRMLQRLIGENVELAWKPGPGVLPVCVDPSQLDQILANLCVNSRDAIADVGQISIETANVEIDAETAAACEGARPGPYVRLSVSDTGCGMDPATLAHVFEPFFTTKAIGKGTGLGLATIYGAVRQNDGFVQAESSPGLGTRISIFLPARSPSACGAPNDADSSPLRRGGETVLLVEDESAIQTLATSLLSSLGYSVLAAPSPAEAIALADSHPGPIHLLLTDVIMPGMNGRDLARKLALRHPAIKCLFMSGYTADVISPHGVLDPGVCFIQKPFSLRQLSAKLREALDAS